MVWYRSVTASFFLPDTRHSEHSLKPVCCWTQQLVNYHNQSSFKKATLSAEKPCHSSRIAVQSYLTCPAAFVLGDAQWHFSPGNPTFTASPSFIAKAICRGCSRLCSKTRGLFVLALYSPCTHFTRTEVRKWCLKKKPREFRIICCSQPTACNVLFLVASWCFPVVNLGTFQEHIQLYGCSVWLRTAIFINFEGQASFAQSGSIQNQLKALHSTGTVDFASHEYKEPLIWCPLVSGRSSMDVLPPQQQSTYETPTNIRCQGS